MPHRYTREKFMVAVDALATSAVPVQERLHIAYESALMHLTDGDVLPLGEELSSRVNELLRQLNQLAEKGILTVGTAEAEHIAEQIARLDEEVARKFYSDELGGLDY